MMRRRLAIPIAAIACLWSGCQAPGGKLGRIEVYSSIETDAETGDAGGLEIALRRTRQGGADVLLVLCEGGCHGARATVEKLTPSALSFLWNHPLAEARGPSPERFVLTWVGPDLVVAQPEWARGAVLKRDPDPLPGQTGTWAKYH